MADISGAVHIVLERVENEVKQRCPRATNELRNQELHVLANPSPSPPGSPPGVRTGDLRRNWTMIMDSSVIGITSKMNYAGYLENGTSKMAARPFRQRIIDAAMPKIRDIFNEPYN